MSFFLFLIAAVVIILGLLAVIIRLCCELLEQFLKGQMGARCSEREANAASRNQRPGERTR